MKISNKQPLYLKFVEVFDGCSADECGFCDFESKVHLEISSADCSIKVPYFEFYKCEKGGGVYNPYGNCISPVGKEGLNGGWFVVFGKFIFTMLNLSPYATDKKELIKFGNDKTVYQVKISIKKRCD